MDTEIHFDQSDQRVLRYLEQNCLAGGGGDFVDITPEDIGKDNGVNGHYEFAKDGSL